MNTKHVIIDSIIYLIMIAGLAYFVGQHQQDTEMINQLNKVIHQTRAENDNLRYQLDQCKLLYIGM